MHKKKFVLADRFLYVVTNPKNSAIIFTIALFIGYVLVPLFFFLHTGSTYLLEIIALGVTAGICVLAGRYIVIGEASYQPNYRRIVIRKTSFLLFVWITYCAVTVIILSTAEGIPIISAMSGSSPEELAILREKFLKAREGWQLSLIYFNAIYSSVIIPYAIALMFINKAKYRWVCLFYSLAYSISFLEKAFFLKLAIPIFVLIAQKKISSRIKASTFLIVTLFILFIVTLTAGSVFDNFDSTAPFYSSAYTPSNPIDHLVWRSISVPVFTAADAIELFNKDFFGNSFLGATSNFFTLLLGFERIEFERLVFEYQWGQNATGTGSSNSVFFVEAFVNFGWFGVYLFSIAVGRIFRLFATARDEAFRSLWLLFAFGLYVSGLIGQMLSNGFLLCILMILLFEWIAPRGCQR